MTNPTGDGGSEARALVALEAVRIHQFLTRSRRLADIVAASQIVEWFSDEQKLLAEAAGAAALQVDEDVQVVRAGGGGIYALVAAGSQADADPVARGRRLVAEMTRRVADQAESLSVRAADVRPVCDAAGLREAMQHARDDIAAGKAAPPPAAALLDHTVTGRCPDTGAPAAAFIRDQEGGVVAASRLKAALTDQGNDVKERWERFLPDGADGRMTLPTRTDWLSDSAGQRSQVAVVHVDVNDLGVIIGGAASRAEHAGVFSNTLHDAVDLRQLISGELNAVGAEVLRRVLERVVFAVETDGDGRVTLRGRYRPADVPLHRNRSDGTVQLPIRPLMLGGDDLLLLCDARIAWDVAVFAAETFADAGASEATMLTAEGEVAMTASAGIAVGGHTEPLARLVAAAEDACGDAKRLRSAYIAEAEAEGERRRRSGCVGAVAWSSSEHQAPHTRMRYLIGDPAGDDRLHWWRTLADGLLDTDSGLRTVAGDGWGKVGRTSRKRLFDVGVDRGGKAAAQEATRIAARHRVSAEALAKAGSVSLESVPKEVWGDVAYLFDRLQILPDQGCNEEYADGGEQERL